MTYDLSILIPAFNCALTLPRAVRSALQSERVQVVIADDASTDQTPEVARRLARAHENVKVVHRLENGRIAAALNAAAQVAEGRYFMRLDSDDWLEPGCLAQMQNVLDNNPDVGFVYGQRRYYGRRSDTYTPRPYAREQFDHYNAAGYSYMFRREVWDNGLQWRALGTFGGAVIDLEDWQHLMAMQAAGYIGRALPDVLVMHYCFRWGGTWQELQNNSVEALAEFKRLWPTVQAQNL